jgi:Domain of unknown function (DUF5615)
VKLLLDEMLSARIAEQLRGSDCDATAVDENPDLRGLPDPDLFAHAQRVGRALVTYNRDDFLVLDREYRSQGREHHGIVILNPRRFPQGAASIGALIAALAAFVAAGTPYPSFIHWLQ